MLLAAAASAFLWSANTPHNPVTVSQFAVLAVYFLYFVVRRRAVEWLKARITYPRTGYAQPPEELQARDEQALTTLSLEQPQKQNVTSFQLRTVGVLFFLLLWAKLYLFMLTDSKELPYWFAPVLVAAIAAMLYTLNHDTEHSYPWWAALVLALAGLVFLWVDVPPLLQPSLPMLLTGVWFAALGSGRLFRYLREAHVPAH